MILLSSKPKSIPIFSIAVWIFITFGSISSEALACWNGTHQINQLYIGKEPCPKQRYDVASVMCKDLNARVCTYEDLFYVYLKTNMDGDYNPRRRWLGDFVEDDRVLCGNKDITYDGDGDAWNFETTCNKWDSRQYWCCWGNW